ncbi:MAG: hypothetical protein WC004_04850 [Candidatus Absconditabacterales bacterium]
MGIVTIALLLLAPILFNATGIVDTFLTKLFRKEQDDGVLQSSISTLMIIGGIIALVVALVILPFVYPIMGDLSVYMTAMVVICGVVYGLAAYPYFHALYHERIENIIPILQTIPLFSYFFAITLLGEQISGLQLGLMIAIIIVTGLFSWDFTTKKLNWKGMLWTMGSSLLYGLFYVLFKYGGGENVNIWLAFFWEHVGVALGCLVFAIPSKARRTTMRYLGAHGWKFGLLNLSNELFFIVGVMIVNYLTLSQPVAIVNTLTNGVQPIVGFGMIFAAYRLRPKIFDREYRGKILLYKMILCVVSLALLGRFFHIT